MPNKNPLHNQVLAACRGLLSEINRDTATPTCGCFDRRYWAWKLIDFPEATFQRNLSALAWLMQQPECIQTRDFYVDTIRKGLLYTCTIQHKNGSFDQAYPYEESYGATAFLLPDLLDAYLAIREDCVYEDQLPIEAMLSRAAAFLYRHAELHGTISNHLAGAALALLKAANFLGEQRYAQKSKEVLDFILSKQSPEGWYVEYGGADPGYQTLCMYYLAQLFQLAPDERLHDSLQSSLEFLQYFIHPDGTFGGEYGSRRTEVYYPGGIALLSEEFPLAAAMSAAMLAAIENGQTVTLADVDMGNTAPLLNNSIKALAYQAHKSSIDLPYRQKDLVKEFPQAGLAVYGNARYYAIIGASTGGVSKVFDKQSSQIVLDDCGLLGQTTGGTLVSTQFSDSRHTWQAKNESLHLEGDFYKIGTTLPTPFKFMLLRLMNLTVMRISFLNELIKKLLVRMLISGSQTVPMKRTRSIEFEANSIRITDEIYKNGKISLKTLAYGGKFSSIHMASARYFTPAQASKTNMPVLDINRLNRDGHLEQTINLDF